MLALVRAIGDAIAESLDGGRIVERRIGGSVQLQERQSCVDLAVVATVCCYLMQPMKLGDSLGSK